MQLWILRGLLVPMEGMDMLVPNVAIAEVINYQPIDPVYEGPGWLLGKLRWRDQDVPVISIEKLCGFEIRDSAKKSRISIINSVQSGSELKFYAVVIAGIPRSVRIDEQSAVSLQQSETGPLSDAIADYVSVAGQEAFIPNLGTIQSMLKAVLESMPR